MKGTIYGLRSTQLSLILIVLTSTTIFLWALEKSPLLTSLIPPHSLSLQLTPDALTSPALISISSEVQTYVSKDETKFTDKDTGNHQGENFVDPAPPVDSARSFPIMNTTVEISKATQVEKKDQPVSSVNETTRETSKAGKESTEVIPGGKGEVEGNYNETLGENFSKKESSGSVGAPSGSDNTSSLQSGEDNKDSITHTKNQACNYAKGKWVVDDNLPLYSGFHCKQWLSPMWSCRLTQRSDFSYEKVRWQPKDCQVENFKGSKFLRRMHDKTLAFVGDSLGRQQFQSLMCMITGGKETNDVKDVGEEYGLAMPAGATRPNGWAFRFMKSNTTILYYWSASLCDLEPLEPQNPDTDYAMHLDRPPAFLRQHLHKINVLVLNTGHHWNRGKFRANRWVMHVGGVPNTDKKLAPIGSAKDFTVHSIVKWVNLQLPKHPDLKAFYRSISPRHFVNGDWNTGGSCNNTTPMSIGKELLQEESSDLSAANAVKGTGVKLLDITGLSALRDEGHMSRFSIMGTPKVQDCLHWCLPGVPDTWNQVLFAQI